MIPCSTRKFRKQQLWDPMTPPNSFLSIKTRIIYAELKKFITKTLKSGIQNYTNHPKMCFFRSTTLTNTHFIEYLYCFCIPKKIRNFILIKKLMNRKVFDWSAYYKNLIAPALLFLGSSLAFYVFTHTPFTVSFKAMTISEYTLRGQYLPSVFLSSLTVGNWFDFLMSSGISFLSVASLATSFKARHFWCLFLLNRYIFINIIF